MITTFNEVSIYGERRYKCPCGRRVSRRKKFYQTLNPYNKTKDGNVKSREQIYVEIKADRAAWLVAEPEPCGHPPKEKK